MIEPEHPALPIARQCELLGLARASYYHKPELETDENLQLMRVIDETYLAYPVFGSRQMTRWLRRQGYPVNRKRVRRVMLQMGLEAIYQKPNTSRKHPQNPIYRYLLRRRAAQPGLGRRHYAACRIMPSRGAWSERRALRGRGIIREGSEGLEEA